MDPLSAWALAVKAVAEMITELSRGQSDAAKKQMWDWFMEDQKRWRQWLKLDAGGTK